MESEKETLRPFGLRYAQLKIKRNSVEYHHRIT